MASGEKTEAPTPKRREDTRKKGQVPKSVELVSVLGLLVSVMMMKAAGPGLLSGILDIMGGTFRNLAVGEWTAADVATFGGSLSMAYLVMMAPLFVTVVLVGVAGNILQTGPMLTTKPLMPDASRISPLKGFKRIFSQRSAMEFFKSVLKLGIVGYVVYQALQDKYMEIITLSGADVRGASIVIAGVAIDVLMRASIALLGVAALDYAYQRWDYFKSIRMTKEELREEFRQTEGDPKIRSKIRQQQRQMASRRMMHDVPKSDVVITNPTHLAVALQYRPESMRSPKVVAKGQLLVARRIKEVAREHGVPVIENKPLAQALFKSVEIGSDIPPALYHAVAEILAFIFSLKRERRMRGYNLGS